MGREEFVKIEVVAVSPKRPKTLEILILIYSLNIIISYIYYVHQAPLIFCNQSNRQSASVGKSKNRTGRQTDKQDHPITFFCRFRMIELVTLWQALGL